MPTKPIIAKSVKRLTLSQLVKLTPSPIRERANSQCRAVRKQYDVGSRDGFRRVYRKDKEFYNEFRFYSVCEDGKRHSYIRFYGPPKADSDVWVWCSCPYFTYTLEVVLAKFNSSTIRLSNGMLPQVRNPKMIPHLCKHLIRASVEAVKQRKDLAAKRVDELKKQKKAAVNKLPLKQDPQKFLIEKGQLSNPAGESRLVDLD